MPIPSNPPPIAIDRHGSLRLQRFARGTGNSLDEDFGRRRDLWTDVEGTGWREDRGGTGCFWQSGGARGLVKVRILEGASR